MEAKEILKVINMVGVGESESDQKIENIKISVH